VTLGTLALIVFVPTALPTLHAGEFTVPSLAVVATAEDRLPPPATIVKFTVTFGMPAPLPFVTLKIGALGTEDLMRTVWPPPATNAIAAGFVGSIFGVAGCETESPPHAVRRTMHGPVRAMSGVARYRECMLRFCGGREVDEALSSELRFGETSLAGDTHRCPRDSHEPSYILFAVVFAVF
jgi:hypothetical protein